jgi:hypothetical protein
MAKPCDRLHSQTIPEATEEGHFPKFCSPRGNENIGFDTLKNLEKEWDLRRIMLTIGIQSDDDLIILLEDVLEPCLEGSPFPKINGMFQELSSIFRSPSLRLIRRSIIDDKGIHMEGFNLFQDGTKGLLSVISRDEDTDLIEVLH